MAQADRDHRICKNLLERFQQISDKINKYKTERLALPKDADGIYLILGGQARIENQSRDLPKKDTSNMTA